jgi:hypothetical protein
MAKWKSYFIEKCNSVFSKTNGLGEGELENINNILNGTPSTINIEKYSLNYLENSS